MAGKDPKVVSTMTPEIAEMMADITFGKDVMVGVGRLAVTGGREMEVGGDTRSRLLIGGLIACKKDPFGPSHFGGVEATVVIIPHRFGEFPYRVGSVSEAVTALDQLEFDLGD